MYETFATLVQKLIYNTCGSTNLMCGLLPILSADSILRIRDIIKRRAGEESTINFHYEGDDVQEAIKILFSLKYNKGFRWSLIPHTTFSLLVYNHLYFDGRVRAEIENLFRQCIVNESFVCSGDVISIDRISMEDLRNIANLNSVSVSALMTAAAVYATGLLPSFLIHLPVDCINDFYGSCLPRSEDVQVIERALIKAKRNPLRDDRRLSTILRLLPGRLSCKLIGFKCEKNIVIISFSPCSMPGVADQTSDKYSWVYLSILKNGILSVYVPPWFSDKFKASQVVARVKCFICKMSDVAR